jgi:hypothetical protein
MADYYPLLARALEGLAHQEPEARRAVFDRARTALAEQLRGIDPPLSESDITRERLALDDAIERVESHFLAAAMEERAAEAERSADEAQRSADLPQEASGQADSEAPPHPGAPPQSSWARGSRERPRVDAVAPTLSRPRRANAPLIAATLLVLVGGIAAAAWLLRDKPGALSVPPATDAASGSTAAPAPVAPAETDAKFADRVSGAERPGGGRAPAAPRSSTAPPAMPAAPPRPEVMVAQRAILMEENQADPKSPKISAGRALWRLEGLNAGQGQPLETALTATIEVNEADLALTLVMRRNADSTLPASHTVELTFRSPNRVVRDVGLLQLKNEENLRGTPIAGLPVPVKDNVFLIGLSDLKGDLERNADLLLHRNWIDLPIRFASGQRAILSFEKGLSGEQVMADAFRQWGGR